MTTEQKRYIKIGLLTLMTLVIVFGGLNFLKEKKSYTNTYDLYLKIDDARQINPSSPIFLNEKKVGNIRTIELLDYSTGLMLTLAIDNGIQIPTSANVLLENDLKAQSILLSFEKMETPFYEARDTITSSISE